MSGPSPGSGQTQTKVCPACGQKFFTGVGVAEHLRLNHPDYTPPRHNPQGLAGLPDAGRRVAAVDNSRRRRCSCGRESTPAGILLRQKATGHTGWTAAP